MSGHAQFLKARTGIILAADVPTTDHLRKLATTCAQVPEVVAIKVGFYLALRYGLSPVVRVVKDVCDCPVIYDHQKAATDIPAMGKPFAEVCHDAGVQGVIFFPHAGPKTLEGFVSAAVDAELVPIIGLVMTHEAYLHSEGGFISDDAPEIICKIGIEMGVRSFVLPGTKPDYISKFSNNLLKTIQPATIMMPGIGTQGGSILSAFNAADGHNPYAIVGSTVYKAPNAKMALKELAEEINKWVQK